MGLVEGPGGLGQGGAAATLGEDSREAEGKYEEYGYNAQLSDRISLDRNIPDYRPKKCRQMSYPDDLPPDFRGFHLCERSPVRHPALRPQRGQPHPPPTCSRRSYWWTTTATAWS
ncbi:hypothetical protein MHYP_G00252460 [Metynnis hypsauchen]